MEKVVAAKAAAMMQEVDAAAARDAAASASQGAKEAVGLAAAEGLTLVPSTGRSSTRYKYVSFAGDRRYEAQTYYDRKLVFLGSWPSPEEAALALARAAVPGAMEQVVAAKAAAREAAATEAGKENQENEKISRSHRVPARAFVALQRHLPSDAMPLPHLVFSLRYDSIAVYVPPGSLAPRVTVVRPDHLPPQLVVGVLTGASAYPFFPPLVAGGDQRLREADLTLYPHYVKRGDDLREQLGQAPFGLPIGESELEGLAKCSVMATSVPWSRGSSENVRFPLALVCKGYDHKATARLRVDTPHTTACRGMLHALGLHPSPDETAAATAGRTPPAAELRTLFFLPSRRALHELYQEEGFIYTELARPAMALSDHRDSTLAAVATDVGT